MIPGALLHTMSLLAQKNIHENVHIHKNSKSLPLYQYLCFASQILSKPYVLATFLNFPSLLHQPLSPIKLIKDTNFTFPKMGDLLARNLLVYKCRQAIVNEKLEKCWHIDQPAPWP